MSSRPELIIKSHADKGTVQQLADLQRQIKLLRHNQPNVPYSGVTTLTFSSINSVSFTVTVPGARSNQNCVAIASAQIIGLIPMICSFIDNANGTVTIACNTYNNTAISGTTKVAWHVWAA